MRRPAGLHFARPRRVLPWHRVVAGLLAASVTFGVTTVLRVGAAGAAGSVNAGGNDTALPSTDSSVTVAGTGDFASLKVTVNQTKNLSDQAISVTWTGGSPTVPANAVNENFLQLFQCWGDDLGGPRPDQCEYGSFEIVGSPQVPVVNPGAADSRIISEPGWSSYAQDAAAPGAYAAPNGLVWMPFTPVDDPGDGSKVVKVEVGDPRQCLFTGCYGGWQNSYFDFTTTNEDDYARTHADGSGSELFHVDTAPYAPGLGCGSASEMHGAGAPTVPKCWLVIVPRGAAIKENPTSGLASGGNVQTSPLKPDAWAHRIVVPLQFNPVGNACAIGANERAIAGGEMAAPAVNNWGPRLCSMPGLPPFNYTYGSEDVARAAVASGVQGAPGMAVVSRPLDPATVDPSNPVVYAPLTLSGLVIGFNIERVTNPSSSAPADEQLLEGQRVAHINLTPRLVAKLLTESYSSQFPELNPSAPPKGYEWLKGNPPDMLADPDFRQYNPEFSYLLTGYSRNAGGLVVEESKSDASYALWQWVLADPEAKAWLGGAPDNASDPKLSGMKVNPYFNTDPAVNPQGGFGNPIPDTFPKNDPYCDQRPPEQTTTATPFIPPKLCMPDMMPYVGTLQASAGQARKGNDGAKIEHDTLSPQTVAAYWHNTPEIQGHRSILSVTDSASAFQYGLQVASLSQAGDDRDSAHRTFVAPCEGPQGFDKSCPGLVAGEQAMVPGPVSAVLQPNPATSASGAYPLTMLTYGAVIPGNLDATARSDYSAFIKYAAGDGQTTGVQFGDLVPGYAPLPADLRAQAVAAAAAITSPPSPTVSASGTATPAPAPAAAPPTTEAGPTASTVSATVSIPPGEVAPLAPAGSPGLAAPPASPASPPAAQVALPTSQAAPAAAKTPGGGVGALRWTVPISLIVGLFSAAGAGLLRRRELMPAFAPQPSNT